MNQRKITNYNFDYIKSSAKESFNKNINTQHYTNKKLNVICYENAIISPRSNIYKGGIYIKDEHIEDSMVHNCIDSKQYPEVHFQNNYVDKEVVYIGMFLKVWGHCLTDNLKHLWFLQDKKYEQLKNLEFVYVSYSEDFSFLTNFKLILNKINISDSNLKRITTPTKYKKVFFPEPCFFYNVSQGKREFTEEYKKIIKKISEDIIPDRRNQKVYFTRTKIKNSGEIGEKRIEDLFKKNGYQIISPELLSFNEQIAIIKGCNTLACTEGSVAHNCIFMNNSSNLIIIRKADYINGYQMALNEVNQINVTYIDSNKSVLVPKKDKWAGPFFLYVSSYLSDFFNIKVQKFPFFSFWFYLIRYGSTKILRIIIPNKVYAFLKKMFRS